MGKPVVFFAHSLDKSREEHIFFFKECLLKIFGHKNVLEGDNSDETTIGKATWDKIKRSDAVFAMFSKRDEVTLKDKQGNTTHYCFCVPHGVIFETGYAKGLDIPVYVVKEDGVILDKIGMAQYSSPESEDSARFIWTFYADINKTKKEKLGFKRKLENMLTDLSQKENEMAYYCRNTEKTTTIFHGGYGIIRFSRTIETKYAIPSLSFFHHFSIKGEVKGEIPPFTEMASKNPFASFKNNSAFFSKAIVSVTKGKTPTLEAKNDNESPKKIDFYIKAKGPFQKKDIFTYEYAIGMPNIFPIPDISPVSSFKFPPTKIDQIVFKIKFERGLAELLKEEPTYIICDSDKEKRTKEKECFDKENGALYTTFTKVLPMKINLPGGRIRSTWQWK